MPDHVGPRRAILGHVGRCRGTSGHVGACRGSYPHSPLPRPSLLPSLLALHASPLRLALTPCPSPRCARTGPDRSHAPCVGSLAAASQPQLLVQVVVKKVLGAIPLQLVREAQRASASAAEAEGVGDALGADNPYARKVAEGGSFYARLDGLLQRYFELFGEGEEGDAPEG